MKVLIDHGICVAGGMQFKISCRLPFDPNNPACVADCAACCCMTGSTEIKNDGNEVLLISAITLIHTQGYAFTLLWNKVTPYEMQPGAVEEIAVRFAPTAFGPYGAYLTIDSDDPVTPTLKISVVGSATHKP